MLRRSFLSRLSGAAALLGFHDQSPSTPASPPALPPPPAAPFSPARHSQDEWFDQVPGSHRVIFDTWLAEKFGDAVFFAGNWVRVNKDAYNLTDKDLAVVICVRHQTAPFAFNDAMWAKYGKAFSTRMTFVDPKTKQPPTTNLYATQLTNLGKQGLQLAVCSLTTRAYTRILAEATGESAEDIFKELSANTIGASHFVPAGIVAVTRAQEHGYAIVAMG